MNIFVLNITRAQRPRDPTHPALPFASHPIVADEALGDVALLGVADVDARILSEANQIIGDGNGGGGGVTRNVTGEERSR